MSDPKDELFGDGTPADEPRDEAEESLSILSDKEISEAKRVARERVQKALHDAEKERIIREEMEALRREEGKRTGKVDLDEAVKVTIDCAEFADRLRVNGQEYFHGYTYDVPRHVYDTMRDIMYRGHLHQSNLDGKDLANFYRRKNEPVLSDKVAS